MKGRRKGTEFDRERFESYCTLGCTEQEISDLFGGMDRRALDRACRREYGMPFARVYHLKTGPVRLALRKNQLLLSRTSAMMAVFLGKNMLGQSDHPEAPMDESVIRESNAQMVALADLITKPARGRTLEEMEEKT